MRYTSRLLTVTIIVTLAVLIAWPGQAFTAEFSADLIRSGGGDSETSKVYIKGKLRREEFMEGGKVAAAAIIRIDKKVTWNLMPEERMYIYHDKTQGSFIMWYSPKLNYPIKLQMKGHGKEGDLVMEYKNIKTDDIPDSMFEIPKGYEKFSIPGMPAGMPSIPGMGK
jgi:hypothetical protein